MLFEEQINSAVANLCLVSLLTISGRCGNDLQVKTFCIYISFTTKSERIKLIQITTSHIISLSTQENQISFFY